MSITELADGCDISAKWIGAFAGRIDSLQGLSIASNIAGEAGNQDLREKCTLSQVIHDALW